MTPNPTWNEIPKDWNPDASAEEAEQYGREFDAQIEENSKGGKDD